MDRHMRDALDRWLTNPPEDYLDDEPQPECTINTPHNAEECNGVHFGDDDT
jgi:hypothetical protein